MTLSLLQAHLVPQTELKQKEKYLQGAPKACLKRYFILPPSEIHLLRFILEAYEGIGLITTIDSDLGLIELNIAPGCEEDVAQVLSAEENNLQLSPVYIENSAVPIGE